MNKSKLLSFETILLYLIIILFGIGISLVGVLNSKIAVLLILLFLGIIYILTQFKIHEQILIFWTLLLANRAFFFRTSSALENVTFNSSVIIEAGITVLVTLFTCIFIIRQLLNDEFKIKHSEKFFIAYLIFIGFSLLWTPNFNYGFLWYLRMFNTILLPILYFNCNHLSTSNHYGKFFNFGHYTALGLLPYVLLAYIALYLNIGFALDLRVQSFWLHPTLASITAFSLTSYFYWCINTRYAISKSIKKLYTFLIPVCFISGFISGGKTGAFAFLIVNAYIIYKVKNLKLFKTVIFVVFLMVLVIILQDFFRFGLTQHLAYYNAKFEGQPVTFLHRIGLWKYVFTDVLSDPFKFFLGNGFTASRFLGIKSEFLGTRSMHAHNALVNTLFESGLTGTGLLLIGIFGVLSKIKISVYQLSIPFYAPILILLLSSLVESVFSALIYPPGFYFFALILLLNRINLNRNRKEIYENT